MFRVDRCEADWGAKAPFCIQNTLVLNATADEIFEVVAGKDEDKWFPGFESYNWETPAPHGVGSVREYTLTSMRFKEEFIVWDVGKRLTFCFSSCSLPLFKHFLEDYRITTISESQCRLEWSVYYKPKWLVRPVQSVIRWIYKKDFDLATQNITRYFNG